MRVQIWWFSKWLQVHILCAYVYYCEVAAADPILLQSVLSWTSSFVVPISLISRLIQSIHLCSGPPFFFQVAPSPESFFRCIVGPVSSRVQTTSVLLSYTSMLYALPSVSPRCHNFSHGLLVCGRMPIYAVIFISVTSIFFTCVLVIGTVSIPYSRPYS